MDSCASDLQTEIDRLKIILRIAEVNLEANIARVRLLRSACRTALRKIIGRRDLSDLAQPLLLVLEHSATVVRENEAEFIYKQDGARRAVER